MHGVRVVVFLVIFFAMLSSSAQVELEHSACWSREKNSVEYSAAFPETFYLHSLTCEAAIVFERDELVTLLGFDDAMAVSRAQLDRALLRLQHKKKFESIQIVLQLTDMSNYIMRITLVPFWSFSKVVCSGMLVGRDRYKHLYLLQPGELFDRDKHRDSLKHIKDACQREGYLTPDIVDALDYDEQTKSVNVTLHLHPGKQFTIHSISIVTSDDSEDAALINRQLSRLLMRELRAVTYSEGVVESAVHQAQELCLRRGFLQASFKHDICIDEQRGIVDLRFSVELGEKKMFEFFGNHFFSDKQLLDHIMLFGKSALFLPPAILVEDLMQLYKDHGFWRASISFEEENNRCIFCISENSRSRIDCVEVLGGNYFSQAFFSYCYAELVHSKGFDQKVCNRARTRIMRAYVDAGFWDCVLGEEEFSLLPNGRYSVTVAIDEGRQRLLRSVSIENFKELEDDPLFAAYKDLKEPVPLSIQLVQEQRRYLLRYFQDHGYLFVNPKPELVEHTDGIDLIWHIEGDIKRVEFGQTILAGSSRLPTSVITRELRYKSGQVWDQTKIDQSLERLQALKIFESMRCYPVEYRSADPDSASLLDGTRDLVMEYVEDDPFELQVRAGAQFIGRNLRLRDLSFRTGGAFLWKNPTNSGDHFLFNADVTGYTRNIVGCYQQPWTFDLPVETKLKGYSIRFDQPVVHCSRERLYRLGQDGFLVSGRYCASPSEVGIGMGIEWMEMKHLSRTAAEAIDFAPRLIDQKVPYVFAEPTALVSFLDDAANPTVGAVTLLSCKAMVPLDKIETSFVKFLAEQQVFVPFFGTSVLALRLRAGHMFNQCFAQIMPSERFYLGGAYSLRAYDADLAPPLNTLMGCDGLPCLVPIGGRSVVNGTVELRWNLFDNFGAVLFTDCGALAQDDMAVISSDSFLGATGFGLRYTTPVGALRFDIGWKWRSFKEERRSYAWFLTLGQAF